MIQHLLSHIGSRPCPECGEYGGLVVHQLQWYIGCTKCNTQYIDPLSRGPWDDAMVFTDKVGEHTISYRGILPTIPETATNDDDRLNFMKYLAEHRKEERKPVAFLKDILSGLDVETSTEYTTESVAVTLEDQDDRNGSEPDK